MPPGLGEKIKPHQEQKKETDKTQSEFMANMKAEDWADLYRAHLKVEAQTTPTIENKSAEFTEQLDFDPGEQGSTTGPSCSAFGSHQDEHRGTEEACENQGQRHSFLRSKPNGLSSMMDSSVGGVVKRTRSTDRDGVALCGSRVHAGLQGCWNTELWPTKVGRSPHKKTCSPNSSQPPIAKGDLPGR